MTLHQEMYDGWEATKTLLRNAEEEIGRLRSEITGLRRDLEDVEMRLAMAVRALDAA